MRLVESLKYRPLIGPLHSFITKIVLLLNYIENFAFLMKIITFAG